MTNTIIPQTSGNNATLSCPDNILIHHWQEWLDSCVNPTIIAKNVSSILDSRKLDQILNRNSKKRYNHSEDLIPSWVVSGLDPLSGERWLSGVQCKPDVSPIRDGKPQKYIGASGYGTTPIFLEVENSNYWQEVLNDSHIPIIITEGAKKAGCLLSANYAAISIPGVSTCRKNGRLHNLLKPYCTYGRVVYLCFDNDVTSKRQVQIALLNLARDIAALGAKVMVMQIPPDAPKGIDDYAAKEGYEVIESLVKNASTIEEWKEVTEGRWQLEQARLRDSCHSRLAGQFKAVEKGWGESLRFNELKNQIEYNGVPIDLESIHLEISLHFDFDVSISNAIAVVERIAKQQSYHPVREYLEECSKQYPNPRHGILDNIAERYFGTSDPLHNSYLRKTLIAAVARIEEPGCQHDAVCVLVGRRHGTGKTSFWRELFSRAWYTDQLGEATKAEDEVSKLHQFWGLEFGEFEAIYKKKEVAALKKFITAGWDVYRAPYARSSKEHPRRSILVGTSNEDDILHDPTGNRRFWMVPVKGMIPVGNLLKERDELWASAYQAYKSGEKWELTEQEKQSQEIQNESYQQTDAWEYRIMSYAETRKEFYPEDLFDYLGIETPHQNDMVARRIGKILKSLGWERERRRFGKHRRLIWFKEGNDVSNDTFLEDFEKIESLKSNRDNRDNRDKNFSHVENEILESSLKDNGHVFGTESGQNRDKPEPLLNNAFRPSTKKEEILIGTESGQTESLDINTLHGLHDGGNFFVPIQDELAAQRENSKLVAQDTRLSTQDGKTVSDKETITTSTLPTIKSLHQSPLGEVKIVATPNDAGYEIALQIPGIELQNTSTSHTEQKKVLHVAKKVLIRNLKSIKFQIHIITAPPGQYEWVDAQFIDHKPNEYDHKKDKWVFLRNGFEYSIQDLDLIRLKPNA